jgi:hypothetical protein
VIEIEVLDAYEWQEVVSPDGDDPYYVACARRALLSRSSVPAAPPPTIEQPMPTTTRYEIPDDLTIPEFLRRPLPRPERDSTRPVDRLAA